MRVHLGRAVDVEVVALLVKVGVVKRGPRSLEGNWSSLNMCYIHLI